MKAQSGIDLMVSYLKFMLRSPISIWWAAATLAIEVLGIVLTGDTIVLHKGWLVVGVFFVSFSVFVGILVLCKGWFIYSQAHDSIRILDITRADSEQVFVLDSWRGLQIGSVLEVHRTRESVEVPIGFIETTLQREDGRIQAKPVWIMPVHLRDIEMRELSAQSLTVCRTLSGETLSRWIDDMAKMKLHDLLRRGGGGGIER